MPEPKEGTTQYRLMKRLYKDYVRNCRKGNIFWGLSMDEFGVITSAPCSYCNRAPYHKRNGYIYTGIDRKDPKKGYELDNVSPACFECNRIKSNILTPEETRVVVQALLEFRRKR